MCHIAETKGISLYVQCRHNSWMFSWDTVLPCSPGCPWTGLRWSYLLEEGGVRWGGCLYSSHWEAYQTLITSRFLFNLHSHPVSIYFHLILCVQRCLCSCGCAHMHVEACICVHVCGGQRLMILSFPQSLISVSLSGSSLVSLGCLSSTLGIWLSLPPRCWNYRCLPGSLCGS